MPPRPRPSRSDAPAPDEAIAADAVVLEVGGLRCWLPMGSVAEVGRPPLLTRVPGVPSWVAGVANWRGRVLAVLHLADLLAEDAAPDRRPRLVVVEADGVRVGLLVDRVVGVAALHRHRVAALPPGMVPAAARLLLGAVDTPDGPVVGLDTAAVLGLRHELPGRA